MNDIFNQIETMKPEYQKKIRSSNNTLNNYFDTIIITYFIDKCSPKLCIHCIQFYHRKKIINNSY